MTLGEIADRLDEVREDVFNEDRDAIVISVGFFDELIFRLRSEGSDGILH